MLAHSSFPTYEQFSKTNPAINFKDYLIAFLKADAEAQKHVALVVNGGELGLLSRVFNGLTSADSRGNEVFKKEYDAAIQKGKFEEHTFAKVSTITAILFAENGELKPEFLKIFTDLTNQYNQTEAAKNHEAIPQPLTEAEVKTKLYGKPDAQDHPQKVARIADIIVKSITLGISSIFTTMVSQSKQTLRALSDEKTPAKQSKKELATIERLASYEKFILPFDEEGNMNPMSFSALQETGYKALMDRSNPKDVLARQIKQLEALKTDIAARSMKPESKSIVLGAIDGAISRAKKLEKKSSLSFAEVQQFKTYLLSSLEQELAKLQHLEKGKTHLPLFKKTHKELSPTVEKELQEMIAELKGHPTRQATIIKGLTIAVDNLKTTIREIEKPINEEMEKLKSQGHGENDNRFADLHEKQNKIAKLQSKIEVMEKELTLLATYSRPEDFIENFTALERRLQTSFQSALALRERDGGELYKIVVEKYNNFFNRLQHEPAENRAEILSRFRDGLQTVGHVITGLTSLTEKAPEPQGKMETPQATHVWRHARHS